CHAMPRQHRRIRLLRCELLVAAARADAVEVAEGTVLETARPVFAGHGREGAGADARQDAAQQLLKALLLFWRRLVGAHLEAALAGHEPVERHSLLGVADSAQVDGQLQLAAAGKGVGGGVPRVAVGAAGLVIDDPGAAAVRRAIDAIDDPAQRDAGYADLRDVGLEGARYGAGLLPETRIGLQELRQVCPQRAQLVLREDVQASEPALPVRLQLAVQQRP